MIVRDEAEMLPRCLNAVRGLWTELRAVDTGSRDGTVALLEAEGAQVIHRAWDDDFSAARNAGLEGATGDWILYLDADEIVSAGLAAQIRALVDDPAAGAATVVIRNHLPHGHRRDASVLRLFRNHPSVRFQFPIHEDVSEAVRARLVADGRRLRHLPGVIEHLGYVRAHAASRNKKARDTELLLRCLENDRNDVYSWFKLLELARFWGDRALWSEAATSVSGVLEAAGPMALAGKPFGGELIALCADGLFPADDAAGALRFINKWVGLVDPSAALFLRRGELRELAGEIAAAAADFARCRELAEVTPDLQLATVRPLMGLARLALATGDNNGAWRRVDMALQCGPRDAGGAAAGAAAVPRARRRRGRAGLRDLARRCVWRQRRAARGAGRGGAGRRPRARRRQRAPARRGRAAAGRAALRLAQAHLAAGEIDVARRLSADLASTLPEAALGVLVCDLLSGRDSDLTLDIDDETAHRELRSWVDLLRGAAPPALLESFRRAAPAVAEFFPWLPRYLGTGAHANARAR